MTRTISVLVSASVLVGALSAQSMEEKYQAKLKKEFVKNASWETSLDAATSKASKENKLIFGYFTRSYSP